VPALTLAQRTRAPRIRIVLGLRNDMWTRDDYYPLVILPGSLSRVVVNDVSKSDIDNVMAKYQKEAG